MVFRKPPRHRDEREDEHIDQPRKKIAQEVKKHVFPHIEEITETRIENKFGSFKKRHDTVDRARKQTGLGARTEQGEMTVASRLRRMDRQCPLLHKVFGRNKQDGNDEGDEPGPTGPEEGFMQSAQTMETVTGDSLSGPAPLRTDEEAVAQAQTGAAEASAAATTETAPTETAPASETMGVSEASETQTVADAEAAEPAVPTQFRMTLIDEPAQPVVSQVAATQPVTTQQSNTSNSAANAERVQARETPGAPKRKLPGQTEWEDVITLSDRRIKATKEATIEVARMQNGALIEVDRGETQRQDTMAKLVSNMAEKYQETNRMYAEMIKSPMEERRRDREHRD
ncbi:hypothetical protein KEM55_004145 [Ascosphaera atra]|nr:hypothetical protein KEM55_004145 [Ascosphaera atra]